MKGLFTIYSKIYMHEYILLYVEKNYKKIILKNNVRYQVDPFLYNLSHSKFYDLVVIFICLLD